MRTGLRLAIAGVCFGGLLLARSAPAVTLPPGFVDEPVATGFDLPTSVAVDPFGRLWVTEKGGKVWVVTDGVRSAEPFVDLTDEVHNAVDRGLLAIALHPDFPLYGYVYLLYGVDPIYGQPDEPGSAVSFGRLTRYTAHEESAIPASRFVILGETAEDGFPECFKTHGVGDLEFGRDGSLLISSGDGAHADFADFGQNETEDDPDCEAMFGEVQDLGAIRSQSLASLGGKLLRVDPESGRGLLSNPFYDGDQESFASRTWALGLRNPFRFTVVPNDAAGPGTIAICDVGWRFWEELNVASPSGGNNFGWPCFEGPDVLGAYASSPLKGTNCSGDYVGTLTDPLVSWHHDRPEPLGFSGAASTGSTWYDEPQFPSAWRGGIFFADFVGGWIRFARLDDAAALVDLESFAFHVPFPVDLEVNPHTGDLLYVSIVTGEVRRIRYAQGNVAPQAAASATPAAGPAPLSVQFSSGGTRDPNGDEFSLVWSFGDGSPPSTEPNPTHVYTARGSFDAVLTVTDEYGLAAADTVRVETANSPPAVDIISPTDGHTFAADEWLTFAAAAFDPEDGVGLDWSWEVQLIHNGHVHPAWFVWSGPTPPPFRAESHGDVTTDRLSYLVRVEVEDREGLVATDEVRLVSAEIGANTAPVAAFTPDRLSGDEDLTVSFDGSATVDADGDYLFTDWDFGDGTTSRDRSPVHTFGTPGAYDVTLSVSDAALAYSTQTTQLLVWPADGLLAAWAFGGAGGVAGDGSGNGRDLPLGTATGGEGVVGEGVVLDGSADLRVAEGFLSTREQFSVSLWFRSLHARGGLVRQEGVLDLRLEAGELVAQTGLGGEVRAPFSYGADQWHHVVLTGDGEALRLYLNGRLVAEGGFSTWSYGESTAPVVVGGEVEGQLFAGRLDEVRIYDRVLPEVDAQFVGTHPAVNRPPRVLVVEDVEIGVDVPVRLTGYVTDDDPSVLPTYRWEPRSGPATPELRDVTTVRPWARFPAPGTYEVALVAQDQEYTQESLVTVRVRDIGEAFGLGPATGRQGFEFVGPNPARADVQMTFAVREGAGEPFRLGIFDVRGRAVRRFPARRLPEGRWSVYWDRRDGQGLPVAPGVYFVSLRLGDRRYTERVVSVD